MAFGINDWILAIAFLFILIFMYGKYRVSFYAKRGIKTLPVYPFVGNMFETLIKRKHFNTIVHNAYNAFPNEKYTGFFQFHRPSLIIKDIELIKKITVKDFEHFQDHQTLFDEESDPLFGRNLFSLKGQTWRDMRGTLSPAFTSSKMRQMFSHVAECGAQMAKYYLETTKESKDKDGILEIEIKDAFTRYTNDVIATAAFGIKTDSLKDRDNEFYLMGKEATTFSTTRFLKFLGAMISPSMMRVFGITLFGKRLSEYFRQLVMGQMKYREKNNIIRQDMINLLMEAKKGSLKHHETSEGNEAGFATVEESKLGKEIVKREWSDDDITAQAVLFFFAGFDSSATAICFLVNELAINPEVQRKLQCEIDEFYEKCNGKLDYNDIPNMKYMDMVMSELLRKWPPGPFTDRKCVKDYELPPNKPGSKPYTIYANEGIIIPIFPIHRDPQYYKNPDKFDPERFSDENKSSILPFTYLPFGLGPRNCIGSRFALMEIKSVIFYMLRNFDFVETSKTSNPLELTPGGLIMIPKNGFWVGLKRRHQI